MLDDALAARLAEIGTEVMLRLGLDPHRYRKYLDLLEAEVIRHEIKKVLAHRDTPDYEPLEMMQGDEGDDEEWKSEPCM
jgi:hypothetical protein